MSILKLFFRDPNMESEHYDPNMESELYVAAMRGNVLSLLELLAKDELLLDKIMTKKPVKPPLHIAVMLGHSDFVEEVLARKAELAGEQDSHGSTPLHLAAAKGYLHIVASLVRVNANICFVCDNYERNPLQVAAMKGHVDVLEYLVQVKRNAARSVDKHGQTILHLCVMHNKLEALKLLIDILGDDEFINLMDKHGNTILHLAAVDGETKTMLFLTNKGVKPNIKNSEGFTALALLQEGKSEEGKRKWQDKMHETLLVVATLLATMTFQANITPPGGLWQEDKDGHIAGESIMAYKFSDEYKNFLTCNTISFIASLSIILLFISGLPLKRHRITTWIPMLIMWVAISFAAATYAISAYVFTPASELNFFSTAIKLNIFSKAIKLATLAWVGLMGSLFLWPFVRLILKLVRKVRPQRPDRASRPDHMV